jgi:hypothetical protein
LHHPYTSSKVFTPSTLPFRRETDPTQVLLEIYGAQLFGYLDGTEVALEKEVMVKDKDAIEVKI